jgi:leucyl-tRNA synthetase
MCGGDNVLHDGLRRLRPARRAVRRADRATPPHSTEANIANMRRQLRRLGLGHDSAVRSPPPTSSSTAGRSGSSCSIFNSLVRPGRSTGRARPIAELEAEFASGARATARTAAWDELSTSRSSGGARRPPPGLRGRDAPVNWCPGLGTVVANEEVTADGRSDRGNFPVFKRNMRQWMMRITAYADRLLDDLDRSTGPSRSRSCSATGSVARTARGVLPHCGGRARGVHHPAGHVVRGDVHGAGARAPDGRGVDPEAWPEAPRSPWTGGATTPVEAVGAYQRAAQAKTTVTRQEANREKTGVFTGSFATNPVNGAPIPVFIADYVLMGTAPAPSWRCPAGTNGTGSSPSSSTCRSSARSAARRGRPWATWQGVRRRRAGDPNEIDSWTGWASRCEGRHHHLARGARFAARHDHLQAARLAVLPPAVLG